jgi:hypothetical protein
MLKCIKLYASLWHAIWKHCSSSPVAIVDKGETDGPAILIDGVSVVVME